MFAIRNRLIIPLALALFGAVAYLSFDLNRTGREEVLSRFNNYQKLLADQVTDEAGSYLRKCSQELLTLASLASARQRDPAQMHKEFLDHISHHPVLAGASVTAVDETGNIRCSTHEGASGSNFAPSALFEWARRADNRGKVYVSARSSPESKPGSSKPGVLFYLATPLWAPPSKSASPSEDQSWAGVLVMSLDLQEAVNRHLRGLSLEHKLPHIWMMDPDGTVLLQSEHPEMAWENIKHLNASCRQCHRSFDYAEKMLGAKNGTIQYQLKSGPTKLAAFAPLSFENANWLVVVNAPQEEITAFARASFRKVLLLIGLLGCAISLASVIVYRMNRSKVRAQEETKHWQEKHRLEEAIRHLNRQYTQLLELVSEGIFGLNTEGRHTFANPAAARMLGYEPDELLGRHSHSLWHYQTVEGKPNPEEQCPINAAFRDGEIHHVDGDLFWRKDGSSFLAEYTSTPICEEGKLMGAVVAFRDITERKRAEAERERLIEELQEALHQVKLLRGLLPICAECKKIRDQAGDWHPVEGYITKHSEAKFTHGLCPECVQKYYTQM